MITIILIVGIVNYISVFLFGRSNVLSCGIFAWAGKNPKKFNKSKLDVLGIMNESRGKHSCGITVDGDISIGIDGNKIYKDFIANTNYEVPKVYPYVIGHTRHATGGAHNVDNAHPFGYGAIKRDDDYHYSFIGVHNGSLKNHKDLAASRGIKVSVEKKVSKNTVTYRQKIDSEILLEAIYKDKNWKVLSEYNGAAALVFVNNNEPNVIYCYHGKSREYNWKNSKVTEERPLWYYKETRNSLYISSIASSLRMIGATDKTIGEFEHNTVYKITDGDVENAEKFTISRVNNYQSESYTNYSSGCNFTPQDTYTNASKKTYPSNRTSSVKNVNSESNIYDERVDANSYGSKIYHERLRYWRTGHMISGIYVYVRGNFNNLVFMGKSMEEARKYFWSVVNKPFHDGCFIKYDSKNAKKGFIPFISNNNIEIKRAPFLYFYKGIRVNDALDYMSCIDADKHNRHWGYNSLSCCSSHPVINIDTYKDKNSQNIILNNEPFTGKIVPLLSEKKYNIKNGNLISWDYIDDSEEEKKDPVTNTNLVVVQELEEIFNDVDDVSTNNNDDDFLAQRLENEIEEIFTGPYKKFPSLLKQLDRYSDLPKGAEAIELLETFIEGMGNLITIEAKE